MQALFFRLSAVPTSLFNAWRFLAGRQSSVSTRIGLLLAGAVLLAACGESGQGGQTQTASADAPLLSVYKSPTCGCCGLWVDHAESEGFRTSVTHLDNDELTAVKLQRGIARQYHSCHTAISESGHVFEGHIPAGLIHDFLASVPEGAAGLVVPGMPIGSPGMEFGDRLDPYDVLLLRQDGGTEVYTRITSLEQQYR